MSDRPLGRSNSYFLFVIPLAAAAALSIAGCKVDDKEFQNRIFACDTSAADPLCGTDADGQPMQCFAARQIGATDFCTQHCGDVPMWLPDQNAVCVQGNALLKACNPEDDQDKAAHPTGACDHAELGCLRTDVLPHTDGTDEGVCITMRTCTENVDCRDPVRSVCAATFLRELYSQNTTLHADNLYCLQEGCDANETSCSPGESCLRKVIPAGANPPDICVPNCDSQGRCPPNHFCLRAISGPANPAVCIPGLLGFVCNTDVDCLLGTCKDDGGTGAGYGDNLKLCTTKCSSDEECNKFDSDQGLFVCNTAGGNIAAGVCATPSAYRGASCDTDADCIRDKDSKCMRTAPTDRQGTCLHPCDATGGCLPRGGINQTCLPLLAAEGPLPICLPGLFGYPCATDNNCVGGLSCRGADPSQQFCTGLCANDDDCAKDKWTIGGWCGVSIGAPICIPPLDPGEPCAQDNQCASGVCGADNTCAGSPT